MEVPVSLPSPLPGPAPRTGSLPGAVLGSKPLFHEGPEAKPQAESSTFSKPVLVLRVFGFGFYLFFSFSFLFYNQGLALK